MKKIIAALTALIMISCFATAANAQDYHTVGDTDNSKSAPDSADLVFLKKVLLGVETNKTYSDVNEDKNVDILDLVCLKKILINTDGITLSQGETAVTDNWN